DRRGQAHRQVELLLHECEALHLDLPAAEVEGGQDLVVRRRRGVRHIRLVEGFLGAEGELLVEDVDHRSLPPPDASIRVYATQSTHKTLTALRQGSMIHEGRG